MPNKKGKKNQVRKKTHTQENWLNEKKKPACLYCSAWREGPELLSGLVITVQAWIAIAGLPEEMD